MKKISLEELLNKTGSLFQLTNLAARRARELTEGMKDLVEAGPKEKKTSIAIKEIAYGKVKLKKAEK